MSRKIYDSRRKVWDFVEKYEHNGELWYDITSNTNFSGYEYDSIFLRDKYLGEGTVLQRDVSNMPVHQNSTEMSEFLESSSPFKPNGAYGAKTSINTSSFGTQPIRSYIVDSSRNGSGFREFSGSIAIGAKQEEYDLYLNGKIPLENWMVPAQNGDRGLAVYDKATGILREYFMVTSKKDNNEIWYGTGGYSIVSPGLDNIYKDNYALQQKIGLSNVAGMHNSFGFVGIQEALDKKINHAVCFTVSSLRMFDDSGETPLQGNPLISWPSRGSDGKLENYLPGGTKYSQGQKWSGGIVTPTHGQWGRVSPEIDPMHNPKTGKPFAEFTRVLIDACKKYGLVFTDTNLWCHAVNTEQGTTFKHFYGVDPWEYKGIIHRQYVDKYGNDGFTANDFPWWAVQWAPVDWGRPSPDWNIRPGGISPWVISEK